MTARRQPRFVVPSLLGTQLPCIGNVSNPGLRLLETKSVPSKLGTYRQHP
jgi:hypothetical protein